MYVSKKLSAVGGVLDASRRLHIQDKDTTYLIDTGATGCVYPASTDSIPTGIKFYAANGSAIDTTERTPNLELRRDFPWKFTTADVEEPIIGADFLDHYNNLVDIHNGRIIDGTTGLISKGTTAPGNIISLVATANSTAPWLEDIIKEFPEILTPSPPKPSDTRATHMIITNGHPVSCRPRRLTGEKFDIAKQHFKVLPAKGILRPSKSNWASPIHMVRKSTGKYRISGDYRRLNNITVPDKYPVPYLNDFQHNLDGKTIFSKLDLRDAFHQIPMDPESIEKTAVATPFGLFDYLYMTFGSCGAITTEAKGRHFSRSPICVRLHR